MTREIRADHVGSLVRPEKLLAAAPMRSDPAAHADLRALEDEAILAVIDRQRSLGLSVVTDGEFRRSAFVTGFMDAVDGFVPGLPRTLAWHGGTGGEELSPNARVVAAPLVARRRIAETEVAFLQVHAGGRFKVALPSPLMLPVGAWEPGVTEQVYPRREDLVAGAAAILAGEAALLSAEGLPYLQVDAPHYTFWGDGTMLARMVADGIDPDCLLRTAIAGDNAIIDATRPETVTGVHLCRGNSMGRWLAEGGYDAVAETLFTGLHCDRLLLEYDDERSGGFAPLRFVPEDKTVVLGLVSTKTPRLESRDTLLARIEEASAVVPIERLALSPQCGFGSAGRGPLTEDEQWRKLELVASVAAEVWG
jgi:5-methyltetrahydropteroyltriglutamate--homocysteine methyltransferase